MKLLFVGISLKVGGIERALVDQVNDLAKRGYNVDLFLFNKNGGYINEISPQVNVLNSNRLLKYTGLTYQESRANLWNFMIRNFFALLARYLGSEKLFTFIFRFEKKIGGYDYAISYFHDTSLNGLYYGTNLFVLNNVTARNKIAWIHSDYLIANMNEPYRNNMYERFDGVVNVSAAMKSKFDSLNILPTSKSFFIYNILRPDRISNACDKSNIDLNPGFKIVTVGRLEDNKGTKELLQIAENIHRKGVCFTWYFLGIGTLSKYAEQFVAENTLKDMVLLQGQVSNPYPYIKQCDLFVSGSKSETFGLSILEALTLHTPVIAFEYEAIGEIIDGNNGVVCSSYNEIEVQIIDLIKNRTKYEEMKRKTKVLLDYSQKNREQFDNMIKRCNH